MTVYRLRAVRDFGLVDVQFSPIGTPLVAWYVGFDEDGDEWLEQRPVLGALLRHEVNRDGEVIGSRVEMAVQFDDTGELCAVNDSALLAENEAFVGVYPADKKASSAAIQIARESVRARLPRESG